MIYKKILDLIIRDTSEHGTMPLQMSGQEAAKSIREDFAYCFNNGDFDVFLDGKRIPYELIPVFATSDDQFDNYSFEIPFIGSSVIFDLKFYKDGQDNGNIARNIPGMYILKADDTRVISGFVGRNIQIYSKVDDLTIFEDYITLKQNDYANVNIPHVYLGGKFNVELDGVAYDNLTFDFIYEDDDNKYYVLGGANYADKGSQKVSLSASKPKDSEEDYGTITEIYTPLSSNVFNYQEHHYLKITEVRGYDVEEPTTDYIATVDGTGTGTTHLENIIVTGDGMFDHLEVLDRITIPTPSADNEAATKAYVDGLIAEVKELING